MKRLTMLVLLSVCSVSIGDLDPAHAQAPFEFNQTHETSPTVNRRMLICCGLPGDDGHRGQMTEAVKKIIHSSKAVLGVLPENLVVLAGDEEMQAALGSDHPEVGIATRETIQETLQSAAQELGPTDGYWCFLIGHSHPYRAESQFNISGRDIAQNDFAGAASSIECREQVFWLTQPISGFWLKPLARSGRIVITATEADLEFTGTEMPYALAAVMADDAEHQKLDDIDGDGTLSLLDLYLATNIEISSRFRAIDRLQTEHGQLDDNGDGRGSELQQPYLPVDPDQEPELKEDTEAETDEAPVDDSATDNDPTGGEVMPKPPLIQSHNLDGFRSRYVLLRKRIRKAKPEEETTESATVEDTAVEVPAEQERP